MNYHLAKVKFALADGWSAALVSDQITVCTGSEVGRLCEVNHKHRCQHNHKHMEQQFIIDMMCFCINAPKELVIL